MADKNENGSNCDQNLREDEHKRENVHSLESFIKEHYEKQKVSLSGVYNLYRNLSYVSAVGYESLDPVYYGTCAPVHVLYLLEICCPG